MQSHEMRRFTVVAPHVRNDGSMSGYPAAIREQLLAYGYDGWTETETHGSWRGKREACTTFTILRAVADTRHAPPHRGDVLEDVDGVSRCHADVTAGDLRQLARAAMPDQEAIQVTLEPGVVQLWEA